MRSLFKTTPAPPALEPKVEPIETGWRVATFAFEDLQPDDSAALTVTEAWRAYLRWCDRRQCAALALPLFIDRFDAMAKDIGMARRQNGANVTYPGVKLKGQPR